MVSIICMMYSDFSFHTFILVIVHVYKVQYYVKYCEDVRMDGVAILYSFIYICKYMCNCCLFNKSYYYKSLLTFTFIKSSL